ncbi:nucleolar protein [Kalmusia sp. IMI 367209]|nr:nucleolar protein [Kalmusia sp. IMI 367209]
MAASESQSKKRKGAADSQPKAKKARKSNEVAATQEKPAKAVKASRKQAADFFSDDEASATIEPAKSRKSKKNKANEINGDGAELVDAPLEAREVKEKSKKKVKKAKEAAPDAAVASETDKTTTKKSNKGKQVNDAEVPVTEDVAQGLPTTVEEQKPKKGKKSKKTEKTVIEVPEEAAADAVPSAVDENKSKKGKKSKQQEEVPEAVGEEALFSQDDNEEEGDLDDQTAALLAGFESERDESDLEREDEGFNENALPDISKKKRKELEKARKDAEPGVIYLGRIPHGFFESQMKKYFSQFGTVNRLRLSRNKKTGASKHYAFIEFANAEVAEIVAKTMHNYLMFGHILQCRTIPPEQVHPELFKGANERFKVDPRNKKAGAAMARGAQRDVWEKRIQSENKRRAGKAKGLQEEFGYTLEAPAMKSVDSVPKKISAVEDGPAQQLLTAEEADLELESGVVVTEPVLEIKSKTNKEQKRKSDAVAEALGESHVAAPKSKSGKKESQTQGDVVADKKRKAQPASQNGAGVKKAKKPKA